MWEEIFLTRDNPKLKILLVGPAGCDRQQLIYRFIRSRFSFDYKLTVGVDILTKEVEYEIGNSATLSIWDIGGQERFSFIRTTFYKGASGVLLVFDLSRASTWESIQQWYSEVIQFAGNIPFILIGNKRELIEQVGEVIDREECQKFAEAHGSIYIETSSQRGENVDEAFLALTRLIVNHKTVPRISIQGSLFNPETLIEKLSHGIPLSPTDVQNPRFWIFAKYIAERVTKVNNPQVKSFIDWVERQLCIKIGTFTLLL